MALQSMTGFSRHEAKFEGMFWAWEIRSVNGKGLDLRIRVPFGFEAVEIAAKKLLSGIFSRGNMQISLNLDNAKSQVKPRINDDFIDALLEIAEKVRAKTGGDLPTTAELMSMRGAIETGDVELDDMTRKRRDEALLESLKVAAQHLVIMRKEEGAAVACVLKNQLSEIVNLHKKIKEDKSRTPQNILAHLENQIAILTKDAEKFDPQRLHQEAVVLATKADLQEEVDRLAVHLTSAETLLADEGPVGRKLDFLAQEFHRECNTICSKSNSATVTSLGLDMKLLIDQFREQVQNME